MGSQKRKFWWRTKDRQALAKLKRRFSTDEIVAMIPYVEIGGRGHPKRSIQERQKLAAFATDIDAETARYRQEGKPRPLGYALRAASDRLRVEVKELREWRRAGRNILDEEKDILSR